ncbi:hypothetical protein RJ639_041800 [Escallonia herrerae]|uniref:NIN-like protein n=1 Tax=Escallonia herrerae TaxID=1293975 RepID=A0AA89B5B4_9ASTE|nr:hypothetical protein RJ639_041800 [Escallonia herrerae]
MCQMLPVDMDITHIERNFSFPHPRPASPLEQRYLKPLFVYWNRDGSELKFPLSPSSSCLVPSSEMAAESSDSQRIDEKIKTVLTVLTFRERRILVQFWAPIMDGGRQFLTTSDQPFGLGQIDEALSNYRLHSQLKKWVVGGKDEGPPGRVFRNKLPEWTFDVQNYSTVDYPQRDDAAVLGTIRGSLAMPVFEPSCELCIGVLELVFLSEYDDYAYEVEVVCRALKNVNLKSPIAFDCPSMHNGDHQNTLDGVLKALEVVCNIYALPLAQTWVPSGFCSFVAYEGSLHKACSSFSAGCLGKVCVTTTGEPFYIQDLRMWQFRKACAEHHLQIHQGVVGRVLYTGTSCFCPDVTKLSETEYPLVHYARMSGLTSCFAILLSSTLVANNYFIIELFLPPHITDSTKQQNLLEYLLLTMKQHTQSFVVTSGMEWGDILSTEVIRVPLEWQSGSTGTTHTTQQVQSATSEPQLMTEDDAVSNDWNDICVEQSDSGTKYTGKKSECVTIPSGGQRRKSKFENSITLEEIRQQFGKKNEDAAASLGVSRSTLKRLCRQYGINRWPSSKRNKNNCSLPKPTQMNESTQGTSRHPMVASLEESYFALDERDELMFGPISVSSSPVSWSSRPLSLSSSSQSLSSTSLASTSLSGTFDFTTADLSKVDNASMHSINVSYGRGNLENLSWSDLQFSDLSLNQSVTSVADTVAPIRPTQGVRTVTVKAKYREATVKFMLPLTSRMMDLEKQVASRLQLNVGSFCLKYLDEDGDLIDCNADMWSFLDGNTTIRLFVLAIN